MPKLCDRNSRNLDVPAEERARVIVEPLAPGRDYEPDSKVCRFDVVV
jgi:hypothetical protein